MCIDGKTTALANRLKAEVLKLVDNVDQAKEMIAENIRTGDSQIAHIAELFYENPIQFRIRRQLAQVKRHPATKKSALRGAIVMVLQEYIAESEKTLDDAALGNHDADAGSFLAIA